MATQLFHRIGLTFLLLMMAELGMAQEKPLSPEHAKQMAMGLELFKKEIRPVLIKQCLECHGGEKVRGDFDLSTRKSLMENEAVGKTAMASRLIRLLAHEEKPHMPKNKPALPKKSIEAIARWLDLGAPYDKPLTESGKAVEEAVVTEKDRQFWSFQPLKKSEPPEVKDKTWPRTPVDRFILAKLEVKGIQPNPSASKRILIRRAYFDLIGLPPTPEEVEAFVSSTDPRAYENLIHRLLDSPRYGERWARHWMDVARFAESHGYEQDYDRKHAYHYRDFLIKALNADMPYDQFVQWQLAGDELAPDDPLAMTATGFLGGGAFPTQLTEAEFESARYDELDDMTATTGVAFLGLSVGCARCHDHKFDPIPTKDYYRLLSTFTTTIRSEIDLTIDGKKTKAQVTAEGYPHMSHHADGRGYPHFYPKTHFLKRGDVHQKEEEAPASFLQVLMRNDKPSEHWKIEPTKKSMRRASLAKWLTDVEDGSGHLLARVIVNRLWHHHFGQGIVATPNDFGAQGSLPTHPELLDWLARDLIANGWKLKRLHKLIMTSAVYMQNNDHDEERAKIDRENTLLWRREARRLEAEAIRDSLLSISGMLDTTMYGPGTLDQNMKRRSIYFFIKRSKLIPMMMLFDWPEHLVSIGGRSQTTVAPQALMFLNSPQARQYAEGFVQRLGSLTGEEALRRAYLIAVSRLPTERELKVATSFLELQTAQYAKDGMKDAARLALVDYCQALMSTNEHMYVE